MRAWGSISACCTTVRSLVFNSDAEALLARRLLPDSPGQLRTTIGMGVDPAPAADAGRFRRKYGITEPFALYVGRREPGKNTPLLLDYWTRLSAEDVQTPRLLLAGPGAAPVHRGGRSHLRSRFHQPRG